MTPRFEAVPDVVRAINEVREQVTAGLDEYIELSELLREFEEIFDAQVVRTAEQLHEILAQRRRLEAEVERIRAKIERGGYANPDELDAEVRSALDPDGPDLAGTEPTVEPPEDGSDGRGIGDGLDELDGVDEQARARILRDFRRIVLPNVHADTSDTPFLIFQAAFDAYRARDHVLMEAFVIRYRGEVGVLDEDGQPVTLAQAKALLSGCHAAWSRFEGRLRSLRGEAGDQEIRVPAEVRQRMVRRNEEFRRVIDDEVERLQVLRDELTALVRSVRRANGGN